MDKEVYMKRIALFIILNMLCFCYIDAQTDSYNLLRAKECLEANDRMGAISYLKKEIETDPNSTACWDLLGLIHYCDSEYGTALSMLNKAVKSCNKKDKSLMATVYYHRGMVYAEVGDTLNAISDYKKAIKLNPQKRSVIIDLGEIYFLSQQYENSNALYKELMKLDSGDPYPYYGMARILYNNNKFGEAKELVKQGELLDSNKERAYIMNMRVEARAGNPKLALEYAVKVLEQNPDNEEAYNEILLSSDTIYQTTVNRLIKQKFEQPENDFWALMASHVYIRHKNYDMAIDNLIPLTDSDSEWQLQALYWAADCYSNLGADEVVVRLMDRAINIDSYVAEFYYLRANARFYLQDLLNAESDYRKMMELNKEYGYFCFYRIGWIKEMQKKYYEALSNYDMSLALNDSYAYTYMMKGSLQKYHLNQEDKANETFYKCIEVDNGISNETCKQYAYLGLGDFEKAIAVSDSILAVSEDCGSYYDAACLYSRMGKVDEAVLYLQKAIEKGFNRPYHIENDDDLDNIRQTETYKELVRKLKSNKIKNPEDLGNNMEALDSFSIPINNVGNGTYTVTCIVNDMPMDFLIDTGATNICISSLESDFMLKNGYISSSDLRGITNYTNASGETKQARLVILKEVRIGPRSFKNIKACIIPNQNAPLLLGQNVLNRLGNIEIDSKNNILKVNPLNE